MVAASPNGKKKAASKRASVPAEAAAVDAVPVQAPVPIIRKQKKKPTAVVRVGSALFQARPSLVARGARKKASVWGLDIPGDPLISKYKANKIKSRLSGVGIPAGRSMRVLLQEALDTIAEQAAKIALLSEETFIGYDKLLHSHLTNALVF